MSTQRLYWQQLICLAFIFSMAGPLLAQEDQADTETALLLEEIIVTARQREEKLTDVPASITAFTEGAIKRSNIERAEDFIALTPGVSFVDTGEVGDSQVSIRGINGTRDAETNFAFIVDGILHTNRANWQCEAISSSR